MVKIKKWITEDGDGHWKAGIEANKEFLEKFGYCHIGLDGLAKMEKEQKEKESK